MMNKATNDKGRTLTSTAIDTYLLDITRSRSRYKTLIRPEEDKVPIRGRAVRISRPIHQS
jgi:hypothetical protein